MSKGVSEKQKAFVTAYGDSESSTFAKKRESALKAGYAESSAGVSATRNLNNPKIIEMLQEVYKFYNKTPATMVAYFERIYVKSLQDGDNANANRAAEGICKIYGFFKETRFVDEPTPKKLTEDERKIAKEVADKIILKSVSDGDNGNGELQEQASKSAREQNFHKKETLPTYDPGMKPNRFNLG